MIRAAGVAVLALLALLAPAGILAPADAAARVPGDGASMAPHAGSAEAGARLDWPLPAPRRITRGYEAPPTPYAAGHRGIDLRADPGDEVEAPAAGVVRFRGRVVDRDVVTIGVGADLLVSLEPVSSRLAVGDRVTAGEAIGTVSDGGHCDRRCLHLGVRRDGEYVSPLLYLSGVSRAVLLPVR